jgi:hypothetical protein
VSLAFTLYIIEEKDKLVRGKLYENSLLPKAPNIQLASKVLMNIQQEIW